MRLLLLLLTAGLGLLAPAARSQPADVQRAFEAGNQRYAAGDYEGALQAYRPALESAWSSGALHYNVAGAHYCLGQLGPALWHYEQARTHLPQSERVRHNLDVARSQAGALPPALPPLGTRLRQALPPWAAPRVLLFGGLAVFVAALAWWVARASDALWPRRRVAGLMAAGLLIGALGLALSGSGQGSRAVALRGPLAVRSDTGARADSTAAVPAGSVLRLTERRGDWAHVRSSRGDEGWVPAGALGSL